MILKKVTITNFLSVTGSIEFDVDQKATILLGANDHGKSNILRALLCLNEDTAIQPSDVNWDATGDAEIKFHFLISVAECQKLLEAARETIPEGEIRAEDDQTSKEAKEGEEGEELKDGAARALLAGLGITLNAKTGDLTLIRTHAGGPLCVSEIPITKLPPAVGAAIKLTMPRAELFGMASSDLQDSVTAAQLKTDQFEFLQGIFFYAGIDPFHPSTDALFIQDDRTERRLDDASKILDEELRKIWGQGVDLDLHFELRHRGSSIEFLAKDPAVKNRKARMSKRSAGVTQFFRLSMILHARQKKHPANSYLYLFDEPGVLLHPKGQRDLIQVFEQLSDETQILYATHSLFMLNQNFPERHRLIIRDAEGTKVDQKPYRANWRLATDALGVHLTANILFSPSVLLVEGDSDPLYIFEMFRQLNANELLDADANMLGIMSYSSELPTLRFLLQTFKDDNKSTSVAVLYDGDKTGKALLKKTKDISARLEVSAIELAKDKSIEDYILFPAIFLDAAEETIKLAAQSENIPLPPDLRAQLEQLWGAANGNDGATRGKWFKDTSKSFLRDEEASKVALARNYVFKCRAAKTEVPNGVDRETALELCQKITKQLGLPSIRAKQEIETA